MADFNLEGHIILTGANISKAQRDLNRLRIPKLDAGNLNSVHNILSELTVDFRSAINEINNVNKSIKNLGSNSNSLAKSQGDANKAIKTTANNAQDFADKAGLALRRFTAFSIAAGGVFGAFRAVSSGIKDAISFEREMLRVSQVTKALPTQINSLRKSISGLSSEFGTQSKELVSSAKILSQAEFSLAETQEGLKAIAQSSLAPTFSDTQQTTEALVAITKQFNIEAKDLSKSLSIINAVSAKYAVESDDLIKSVQRTGGVFAASSQGIAQGNHALAEFVALITSVRSTTRESAETVATGLRTIISRLQRPVTVQFLENLGIQLRDANGQFVGTFEAIQRIGRALNNLPSTDARFAQIVEQVGGFRQVSKVIPLIQQTANQTDALAVALAGQNSIVDSAAEAQGNLAVELSKTREQFEALIRNVVNSDAFQALAAGANLFARSLISVTDALSEVLPLLTVVAGIRFASGFARSGGIQSFTRRVFTNSPNPISRANGGGVPGVGSGDTVPAMLTPGEFVINKKSAARIGPTLLAQLNKGSIQGYNKGGFVQSFASGGSVSPNDPNFFSFLSDGKFKATIDKLSQSLIDLGFSVDQVDDIVRSSTTGARGPGEAEKFAKQNIGREIENGNERLVNEIKKQNRDNFKRNSRGYPLAPETKVGQSPTRGKSNGAYTFQDLLDIDSEIQRKQKRSRYLPTADPNIERTIAGDIPGFFDGPSSVGLTSDINKPIDLSKKKEDNINRRAKIGASIRGGDSNNLGRLSTRENLRIAASQVGAFAPSLYNRGENLVKSGVSRGSKAIYGAARSGVSSAANKLTSLADNFYDTGKINKTFDPKNPDDPNNPDNRKKARSKNRRSAGLAIGGSLLAAGTQSKNSLVSNASSSALGAGAIAQFAGAGPTGVVAAGTVGAAYGLAKGAVEAKQLAAQEKLDDSTKALAVAFDNLKDNASRTGIILGDDLAEVIRKNSGRNSDLGNQLLESQTTVGSAASNILYDGANTSLQLRSAAGETSGTRFAENFSGIYGNQSGFKSQALRENRGRDIIDQQKRDANSAVADISRAFIEQELKSGRGKANISQDVLLSSVSDKVRSDSGKSSQLFEAEKQLNEINKVVQAELKLASTAQKADLTLQALNESAKRSSDLIGIFGQELQASNNVLGNITGRALGSATETGGTRINPFENASALSGADLSAAIQSLEVSLNNNFSSDIKNLAKASSGIGLLGPKIREGLSESGQLNKGSAVGLQTSLAAELGNGGVLADLPDTIKNQISAGITNLTPQDAQKFADTGDISAVIGKLAPSAENTIEAFKKLQDASNAFQDSLLAGANQRTGILDKGNSLFSTLRDVQGNNSQSKKDLFGYGSTSKEAIFDSQRSVRSLTGGTADPKAILSNINQLENERSSIISSGPLDDKAAAEISSLNSSINSNKTALDKLTSGVSGLAQIQQELAKIESRRQGAQNSLIDSAFASPDQLRQNATGALAFKAFNEGGGDKVNSLGLSQQDVLSGFKARESYIQQTGTAEELDKFRTDFVKKIGVGIAGQGAGQALGGVASKGAFQLQGKGSDAKTQEGLLDKETKRQEDAIGAQIVLLDQARQDFDQQFSKTFINGLDRLQEAAKQLSIPENITMSVQHSDINVNLNGADVFSSLDAEITKRAQVIVNDAIQKLTGGETSPLKIALNIKKARQGN